MAKLSPFKLGFVIFWRLALFAGVIFLVYFGCRPRPVVPEFHQYVGDPRTGCFYPAETKKLSDLPANDEEGPQSHWDEFASLDQAKKAGYHACAVPPHG
ncbi:hypothetical protein [Fimbriimonas ginsengisoli]|uniref:Uncharacterized protein n=1 Tax=Fimbriimonas ginsengisoli Gsoil 348 TaxID=661478 RepID=A0A068NJP2_FIMGI|nr:hypothetical protein [Fimbriimonas ginsengisoli]AIE83828.1 hypothetical protein OP10G_0460 [Fimbriimonas ginsengisoli Gsoil 348]